MQPGASSASQTATDQHLASPLSPPRREAQSRVQVVMQPREPPTFSGDREQDVIAWLSRFNDFFALVPLPDEQAVAYSILQLKGNPRAW